MNNLQHLGVVSFGLLVVGLAIIPLVWPHGIKYTFSQHVAPHRYAIYYFVTLFTLFIPLFLAFFLGWFAPHVSMPQLIVATVIGAAVTQYMCAFIPETTGWKRSAHRFLTGTSAFLLLPTVFYLSTLPYSVIQIMSFSCLVLMVLLSFLFLSPLTNRYGESYVFQILYYLGFFVPILTATYVI